MSPTTVSLYTLAALLGLAPAVLRQTLSRAGVKLTQKEQATESDLARVFGPIAAQELVERTRVQSGRLPGRSPSGSSPVRSQPADSAHLRRR